MPTDKRERQRINRAAKLAAQQKRERREKTRRTVTRWSIIALIVVGALYIFSLRGGDDTATEDPESSTLATDPAATTSVTVAGPDSYAAYRAQPTACGGEPPPALTEMSFDGPEDEGLSGSLEAVVTTSCGDITIALDADAYPETVNSFVFLARQGFFDGTACHRFLDGFVLQCGDPTATGRGDAGYEIPDEFPDDSFVYGRGVVAMANAGPGTTGSQFFIVTGDAGALPPQFSILGEVVGSDQTLTALDDVPRGSQAATGEPSAPLETIYIEQIEIVS